MFVTGTQLYRHLADQMQHHNPSITYTAPTTYNTQSTPKSSESKSKLKSRSFRSSLTPLRPRPARAPDPIPALEDRLPLHSPVYAAGVAVSSIKRDLENEKEAKKRGIVHPGEEAKEKTPKLKRVVVRGKR